MADIPNISFDDADHLMSWGLVMDAISQGHTHPKGDVADSIVRRGDDTLLTRSAWIDGLGVVVKAATVIPNNNPSIDGGVMLMNDTTGALDAVIDFRLITKWKTVGDSLLAASILARPDSKRLVILGAGTVARNLIDAYRSVFPGIQISIWNRTIAKAETLARETNCDVVGNLGNAVSAADIVSCATMSTTPVLRGEWLRAGCHVDLIGAYRPDMREADDAAITAGTLFVDSRDTTIAHIGELRDPIARGVISADSVKADYYDLASGKFARSSDSEITIFKNGGGAHLDLMVANAALNAWRQSRN
jgi:ornithine cyclodeaminase